MERMFWALLLVVLIVLFMAARSSPTALAGIVNRLCDCVAGGLSGVKEDVEDVRAEWRDVLDRRNAPPAGQPAAPHPEGDRGN
jgi:hypothetical protein